MSKILASGELLYEALLGHRRVQRKKGSGKPLWFLQFLSKGHTSHISIPPIFQWLKQVMGKFLSSAGQMYNSPIDGKMECLVNINTICCIYLYLPPEIQNKGDSIAQGQST